MVLKHVYVWGCLFLIKMKKLGPKRINDLPRVTELETDRSGKQTWVSDSKSTLVTVGL